MTFEAEAAKGKWVRARLRRTIAESRAKLATAKEAEALVAWQAACPHPPEDVVVSYGVDYPPLRVCKVCGLGEARVPTIGYRRITHERGGEASREMCLRLVRGEVQ